MAGSLSGIAGQQQVPISQTSQQDQNNTAQIREQNDRQPEENRVQPQGTPAAETQNAETSNQDDLQRRADELLAANQNNDNQQNETLRRGSLVDIVT